MQEIREQGVLVLWRGKTRQRVEGYNQRRAFPLYGDKISVLFQFFLNWHIFFNKLKKWKKGNKNEKGNKNGKKLDYM